jgi:hypothetical protein
MKNLGPDLKGDNKIEIKHFLENTIMDQLKANYSLVEKELEVFKPILEGLAINE